MTGKEKGAPTAEVFPELTRDVIDRMGNAKNARLREATAIVIRHLHAIVRGSEADAGRVVASHRLHHACRQYDFGLARELHSGSDRPPRFVAANNKMSQ
jgi:hypothetical protein